MRTFAIAVVSFLVLALAVQDAYGRPRRGGRGGHSGGKHHRPIVCDAVDKNTGHFVCARPVTCPSSMQCLPAPAENTGRRGKVSELQEQSDAVNITVKMCQPKVCSIDLDCPTGFSCQVFRDESTKRCKKVRNCTSDASCPAGFVCTQDETRGSSRCKREPCTSNSTCPTGFYCSTECQKCKPQKDDSCKESVLQLCEARGGCASGEGGSSEEDTNGEESSEESEEIPDLEPVREDDED